MSGEPPYRVHHITEQRVVEIATALVDKRSAEYDDKVRGLIKTTVGETLLQLGIRVNDPTEMQKDFAHNHSSRLKKEQRSTHMEFAAIGAICSALLFLLVLGFRAWLG